MRITFKFLGLGLLLLLATSCRELLDIIEDTPHKAIVKDFATGLATPIGLVTDSKGQVWVAEAGTAKNDGRISLLTPDGKVYPAIEGFPSVIYDGFITGVGHLALRDGILYILLGGPDGKLYKADVSNFHPGDTPLKVTNLQVENIGAFVINYKFENDTEGSNLYNLTFGPDGDIYMVDAAANAIIRRDKLGNLSVFATVPGIKNPTPVGPLLVESVPTGIVFDGSKFLVTTFLGFPFPPQKALVYQFDLKGKYSIYQQGLSSLIDIELGFDNRPFVLEIGKLTQTGIEPKTGKLLRIVGKKSTVIAEGLTSPTSIVKGDFNTYYVSSMLDGKVLKVIY